MDERETTLHLVHGGVLARVVHQDDLVSPARQRLILQRVQTRRHEGGGVPGDDDDCDNKP